LLVPTSSKEPFFYWQIRQRLLSLPFLHERVRSSLKKLVLGRSASSADILVVKAKTRLPSSSHAVVSQITVCDFNGSGGEFPFEETREESLGTPNTSSSPRVSDEHHVGHVVACYPHVSNNLARLEHASQRMAADGKPLSSSLLLGAELPTRAARHVRFGWAGSTSTSTLSLTRYTKVLPPPTFRPAVPPPRICSAMIMMAMPSPSLA
jgi:hypothetical protein